jgi:hypothetical protein
MLISRKTPLSARWNTLKPSRKGCDEAITFEPVGRDAETSGCGVEPMREQAKRRLPHDRGMRKAGGTADSYIECVPPIHITTRGEGGRKSA